MHPMLNIAVRAARAAGAIINRAALDLDILKVAAKGTNDCVTEGERAAEQALLPVLRSDDVVDADGAGDEEGHYLKDEG